MFTKYFRIAFRNLWRHKSFSLINILGLATGLATCLLIMLYIMDESSYDRQHRDLDSLYRIASVTGTGETWAAGPGPMAAALKNDLPEVEQSARLMTFPDIETMLMKYGQGGEDRQFFESNGYYVDSTFFQLFTYDFVYGNAATTLEKPNSIVLSKQLAGKFFKNDNPVGKALLLNTPFGEFNYTITGVFDDTKNKSHIPANYFLSMRNNDMWNWVERQTKWTNNNVFFTYVKLKPGAAVASFEKKLQPFFDQYAGADMKAAGFSKKIFIQPVKDIYLHSALGNEIAANGNIRYLYIMGSIAVFILLIACINFMNLSTARSEKRAREVGVRKVMGAQKSALVRQFLGESFVMSLLALVLAIGLAFLFLPVFNLLAQKKLHAFDQPGLLLWIVGLTLFTGLLAGIYPAFYLSAFKPVAVLKGKIVNNFSAIAIRKGLVVFQFAISICLVLGAIVIWQQLNLLKNRQLGFKKEQQLVIPLAQAFKNSEKDYTAFKNELVKVPGVGSVTSGSTYPGITNLTDMLFYPEGKTASDMVDVHLSAIENGYIETLGFQLLNGRSFSKDYPSDSAGIILNETAVKQLGYSVANAVGRKVLCDYPNPHSMMEIVGVVKDFNFESLHNEIKPCGFTTGIFSNKYGYVIAGVTSRDYAALVKNVKNAWAGLNPNIPFEYSFIDQDFQRNYNREERTSNIVVYFTSIAILIACLGLFGLAAFSAEQRKREIGIRKVLGASASGITAMLSMDFIKLVLIALLIASPLAWFMMKQWLQDFAYRVNISWWMFAIAGLLAILIALATVSFQSIRAAIANPVKSLRTE